MTNSLKSESGSRPVLLALDWGTSSLRGFLMAADGAILRTRTLPYGIQKLPQPGIDGFEQAFKEVASEWLAAWPQLAIVASGMVGSAQGWKEMRYIACPADVQVLAEQAGWIESRSGARILVAPGILFAPAVAAPDVIRGEEIQIAGALALHPEARKKACMVLPGTHSKWVRVEDGRIVDFFTYMTGELYAILCQHSILGRLMPPAGPEIVEDAFIKGLKVAADGGAGDLSHQLFSTRTLGLTDRMPKEALRDYLSGLLIGNEMVSGLATMRGLLGDGDTVVMIGEAALCRRYELAFREMTSHPTAHHEDMAAIGLFRFAHAAGLIDAPAQAEA